MGCGCGGKQRIRSIGPREATAADDSGGLTADGGVVYRVMLGGRVLRTFPTPLEAERYARRTRGQVVVA